MKALQVILNEMNFYAGLFGEEPITYPLSTDDIKKIAEKIECDLSPENLTCNGAASPRSIAMRTELLTTAQGNLAMICGEVI